MYALSLRSNHPSLEHLHLQSYTAFLHMHSEYYEQAYYDYLFQQWINWHQKLKQDEAMRERRASVAAVTLHRDWSVYWTRPRVKLRRARSEINVSTVDGAHHSVATVSHTLYSNPTSYC